MIDDNAIADDLIPGKAKRSKSYHGDYGGKTYGEIKRLAQGKSPDMKARRMKKLIERAVQSLPEQIRRRPK
jgi:hypothetical protein